VVKGRKRGTCKKEDGKKKRNGTLETCQNLVSKKRKRAQNPCLGRKVWRSGTKARVPPRYGGRFEGRKKVRGREFSSEKRGSIVYRFPYARGSWRKKKTWDGNKKSWQELCAHGFDTMPTRGVARRLARSGAHQSDRKGGKSLEGRGKGDWLGRWQALGVGDEKESFQGTCWEEDERVGGGGDGGVEKKNVGISVQGVELNSMAALRLGTLSREPLRNMDPSTWRSERQFRGVGKKEGGVGNGGTEPPGEGR